MGPPLPVVSVLPAWYVPRVCALVAGALDVCLVAIFYLFGGGGADSLT